MKINERQFYKRWYLFCLVACCGFGIKFLFFGKKDILLGCFEIAGAIFATYCYFRTKKNWQRVDNEMNVLEQKLGEDYILSNDLYDEAIKKYRIYMSNRDNEVFKCQALATLDQAITASYACLEYPCISQEAATAITRSVIYLQILLTTIEDNLISMDI